MLLSIVVSLYTSRVVLQTLGVEDYGIYGVVGGVVAMFSFLNAAMSGATSRFLTYEMGKVKFDDCSVLSNSSSSVIHRDLTPLEKTFSSAMIIHVGIAITVLVLAATIGLWFLNNKLVIPEDRMTAAYWVYLCSILGMFVGVTQVPYNASIIAHEKMDVYAYVELLHVFLKLGIVYLLLIGNFDKLILYACLVLGVNVIIAMTYRMYCLKHYEETHFHKVWDKSILKGITSFSLYNLLGNFGAVFNLQGINFLINMFFGVALNAAASVASTVSGVVQGFISNVITAFRPPITKAYARQDVATVERLLKLALMSSIIVNSFFTIPLLLELDTVLLLWLGTVPEFASTFCRIILISIYFETIRYILVIGVHAVGKVRNVSMATGILYLLNPFAVYVCLKTGLGPEVTYIGNIIVNVLLIGWVAMLLHRYIPCLAVGRVMCSTIIPSVIALSTFAVVFYITHNMAPNFLRVIDTTIISCIIIGMSCYLFCLNKLQRQQLNSKIKSLLRR